MRIKRRGEGNVKRKRWGKGGRGKGLDDRLNLVMGAQFAGCVHMITGLDGKWEGYIHA